MGGVTDPVITPFVRRMVASGYTVAKAQNSRADKLGRCPRCQGSYLFTFLRGDESLDLCPWCDAEKAAETYWRALADSFYAHIAHGDDEHRAWLRRETDAWFSAQAPALAPQRQRETEAWRRADVQSASSDVAPTSPDEIYDGVTTHPEFGHRPIG